MRHHPSRKRLRGRGYLSRLGPGIVSGAADDDPSGIATYSQIGAATGFRLVWGVVFLLPFAFAVQEACARLAIVTGHGLAGIIRTRLPRPVLYISVVLVAIANTVNIAADLASMAAALNLILPIPQMLGVVGFAVVILVLEILVPYHRYAKFLRWLCLSLVAYVAVLFVVQVPWAEVEMNAAVPHFLWAKADIALLIAMAGTTISPYLFFWQSAEEVEARNAEGVAGADRGHMRAMRGDVAAGMLATVVVAGAILVTAAATLNANGIMNIQTAEQAAQALAPIAGPFASLLFLIGIVGTGLLTVPVLAGATSYALAETFGWSESLEKKPTQARAFYAIILLSILVGLALNLGGIDAIQFLIIAAIINGLTAPFLMAVIWWLARDKKLMGRWASRWWSQGLVALATLAMAGLPVLWLLAP
jgi:NRAMP (natural resistance-associated macrophage protein)-like metal ion transporter